MSQTTLDDDDLFNEAADEMRDDVEENLTAARDVLPDPETIWEVDADNTLGVLNALKGALDVEDAETKLRDAKKWYAMGREAEAFDDADDLEADIAEIESLFEQILDAHDQVSELTAIIPELRGTLEEVNPPQDEAANADTEADADIAAEEA